MSAVVWSEGGAPQLEGEPKVGPAHQHLLQAGGGLHLLYASHEPEGQLPHLLQPLHVGGHEGGEGGQEDVVGHGWVEEEERTAVLPVSDSCPTCPEQKIPRFPQVSPIILNPGCNPTPQSSLES